MCAGIEDMEGTEEMGGMLGTLGILGMLPNEGIEGIREGGPNDDAVDEVIAVADEDAKEVEVGGAIGGITDAEREGNDAGGKGGVYRACINFMRSCIRC